MNATHLLRTERLDLRPCGIDDLEALHGLWCEGEVRRFLFDDRCISRDEARSFVEASVESFANHSFGLWLFRERHGDPIAGFAGLLGALQEPPRLIFGTRPQLWGRGYATEAAAAVLRYAMGTLGLTRVLADVDEPNTASGRVLEKLGMSRTSRALVNGRPILYYEIARAAR